MMGEVFLDTAYAIALSSPNDLFHHRAIQLADQIEAAGTQLDGTIGGALKAGLEAYPD